MKILILIIIALLYAAVSIGYVRVINIGSKGTSELAFISWIFTGMVMGAAAGVVGCLM